MSQNLEANLEFKTAYVCTGVSCKEVESIDIFYGLKQNLEDRGSAIEVKPYLCFGNCHDRTVIAIEPGGPVLINVKEADINEVAESLVAGRPLDRLVMTYDQPMVDLIHGIIGAHESGDLAWPPDNL